MKKISYSKTNNIIQSLNSGKSYGNISVEQGVSKSTVYKIATKNAKIEPVRENVIKKILLDVLQNSLGEMKELYYVLLNLENVKQL